MSSTSNPIYFVHVGKTGGTSLDSLFLGMDRKGGLRGKRYVGHRHFDWSYVRKRERVRCGRTDDDDDGSDDASVTADVVTLLRRPVDRVVSQFHYSKYQSWAKKSKAAFVDLTLEEWLADPTHANFTMPIVDGSSGTDFLAGVVPPCGWIETDGSETRAKRRLRSNRAAACLLAAERLDRTAWFGLLEEPRRSMELLAISMGWDRTPVLPKRNQSGRKMVGRAHPAPSPEAVAEIESHLPGDLWLYEYATRLFEARWTHATTDAPYAHPDLPPLPDFSS